MARLETAAPVDVWAGVVTSTALAVVVWMAPESALRVVLGLPFVLFFPGHALLEALAPRVRRGEGAEQPFVGLSPLTRGAMSAGLSAVVVVAVGLILNVTVGVGPRAFVVGTWAATVALYAWGLYRRLGLPVGVRPRFSASFRRPGRPSLGQAALSVALVAALGVTGATLHDALQAPKGDVPFTEFYLLGPHGGTAHVPTRLHPGDAAGVRVGVVNHEGGDATYALYAFQAPVTYGETDTGEAVPSEGDRSVVAERTIALNAGDAWEERLTFDAPTQGTEKVVLHLYKGSLSAEPYRELFLWVRAVPEGGSL